MVKEALFHLYYTFLAIPGKTHLPQKKKCWEEFDKDILFLKVLKKKFVINSVLVVFPPDLEDLKLTDVETYPPLIFCHT